MVVTSQCDGHHVIGILVGESDVERYFSRTITAIELQIGHLRIECELPPQFWNGKPEIRDPRLGLWLESKADGGNRCRVPTPLAMIPSGANSFILDPAQLEGARQKAHRKGRV